MKNIGSAICIISILLLLTSCKEDQPSEPPASKEPTVKIVSPQNNSAVYGSTNIEIAVTHDKNITKVEVFIDGISDPGKTFEYDPGIYRYVWTIPQAEDGKTHNIYAKAEDDEGNTGRSETIEVVVYQFPAPTELGITHISQNEVKLNWVDNAEYEEGYIIERKTGIDYSEIGRVDADIKSYNDNTLSKETEYYYRVKAYTGSYNTGYSNEIRIHYVQNLDMSKVLVGHTGAVTTCDFNPVQDILATASSDYSIKLWSTTDGDLLHTLNSPEGFVNSVVFTPDGEMLASAGSDKIITIWDVQTGQFISNMGKNQHTGDIHAIDIHPDGNTVVSVGSDKLTKIWDLEQRQLDYTMNFSNILVYDSFPLIGVKYDPQGEHIAFGSHEAVFIVRPSDSDNYWPPVKQFIPRDGVNRGRVLSINYKPDGNYILAGYNNGMIRVWNVGGPGGLETMNFNTGYLNEVYTVVYSPDEEWLLSGGSNEIIYMFRAETLEKIHSIETENGGIYSIDYSPDGTKAASCHYNGNVILWDVSMKWTLMN